MAQNINMNNFKCCLILERNKLNGSNHLVYSQDLKIVFKKEKEIYGMDAFMPSKHAWNALWFKEEVFEIE